MEGINVIFKNKEGNTKIVFITKEEIWNNIDSLVYDKLTEPDCSASSCAVNNFCECDPINDDYEYNTMEVI